MPATPANSVNQNSTISGLWTWDGITTTSTTALTQYNVLSGASSNTVNNISPSTDGFVLTSNGTAAQPTFKAVPFTGLSWTTTVPGTAVAGKGYIITATTAVTLPVPLTDGATIGFIIDVDPGTGLLTITAGALTAIRIGNIKCAVAGTCVNNLQGDTLNLVYCSGSKTWISTGTDGTWTLT